MVTQDITLKDILEIENNSDILSFKCPETGYLLWPFIRNIFIRFIKQDALYKYDYVTIKKSTRPRKAFLYVFRAFAHNLKNSHLSAPILISAPGGHQILTKEGKCFDPRSEIFALAVQSQTLLLQGRPSEWQWPFPRYNERVIFDAPIIATGAIVGKVFTRNKQKLLADEMISFLSKQAKTTLDWKLSNERRAFLVSVLSKTIATLPVKRSLFYRLLKRTGARILIRCLSCYGGDSSILNIIARENGIVTSEYQHGIVHSGHDAYNFAPILCGSAAYRATLPEYFLSYGTWWNNLINAPINKVAIGNPFRSIRLQETDTFLNSRNDIIVFGDGVETDLYIDLCLQLAEKLKHKMRVVFRPHPLERSDIRKYILKHAKSGIFFEWEKDIYSVAKTAVAFVSETSTVLFESIGLVEKIFIWNTPKARFSFPFHPFTVFSDADDLIAKICDDESGRVDTSIMEEFWAPNWKENYLSFLEGVCPGILDTGNV